MAFLHLFFPSVQLQVDYHLHSFNLASEIPPSPRPRSSDDLKSPFHVT